MCRCAGNPNEDAHLLTTKGTTYYPGATAKLPMDHPNRERLRIEFSKRMPEGSRDKPNVLDVRAHMQALAAVYNLPRIQF